MDFKNFEDGRYEFEGNIIDVKDGAFELDGQKYIGFSYDDGEPEPLSTLFQDNVAKPMIEILMSPVTITQSVWKLATGQTLGSAQNTTILNVDPSAVRRIDTEEHAINNNPDVRL